MTGTTENTLKHVLFLARHLSKCDLSCVVLAMLLELGIPTKRDGFDYLKKSIVLRYYEPTRLFSKDIYLEVGEKYCPPASEQQVEQAIRSAIEEAWKDRNEEVWRFYFPSSADGRLSKPSNAEFISRVARYAELCQGCRKEGYYGNRKTSKRTGTI